MIEVYLKTNTNYEFNGDITLNPISAPYKDSTKVLEIEHERDDLGRYKYLKYENVVAVTHGAKKQLYRIYNVTSNLDTVKAYARPIFYDLKDTILMDVRPTNKSGQEALDIALSGTGFTGHSNIAGSSTAYWVRKNIVEALLSEDENSFLSRWGGEYLLDNFDIYINSRIGSDNGVRVEFGYNLSEIEEDVNIDDVVTRIIPIGFNGITLDGDTPWVDSPVIDKYTHVKTKPITFDDVKVKGADSEEGFDTLQEAQQELINRCNKLYENGIDKPVVNYKVSMVDLSQLDEYKKYKQLLTVNKGDTVTCYIKDMDINVQARVIDFEIDEITGEYNTIELGNATTDFFKDAADINNKVNDILNSNGSVKAASLQGVIDALDTKFRAMRDIASKQNVRAMLFEDRVEDSPTFGAMCLGSMGFEIADGYVAGTQNWNWRTFGTGKGFVADCIVAGTLKAIVLQSVDGSCKIDLGTGIINVAKGIIKGLNSSWNLDTGVFSSSATINGNTRQLQLKNGGLFSENQMVLEGTDLVLIQVSNDEYDWPFNYVKIKPNGIDVVAKTKIDGELHVVGPTVFDGSIDITGTLRINGQEVYPGTGGGTVSGGSTMQKAVVNSARKLIGVPYVYGGNYTPLGSSTGTDCSGLCQWAYNDNGISISRTTYTQISEGIEVNGPDDLQAGDLIFPRATTDNGHVFMFSGKNASGELMCIEAYDTGYNISEHVFTWSSSYRARRIISD